MKNVQIIAMIVKKDFAINVVKDSLLMNMDNVLNVIAIAFTVVDLKIVGSVKMGMKSIGALDYVQVASKTVSHAIQPSFVFNVMITIMLMTREIALIVLIFVSPALKMCALNAKVDFILILMENVHFVLMGAAHVKAAKFVTNVRKVITCTKKDYQ